MYAHALTCPSLRAPRQRGLPVRRPLFFPRRNTQHVRVVPRRRASHVSWMRELVRVSVALANVAVWAALLYFFA